MSTSNSPVRSRLEVLLAFLAGLIFAVGLAVAGMTQPAKVVGFLDVAGAWDPSLMFVMGGAIAVYAVAARLVRRQHEPLVGGAFHLPSRRDLDPKLLLGAALFGVGWGLAGYCPGPGLTSLSTGSLAAGTFVLSMAAGMLLFQVFSSRTGRKKATAPNAARHA